MFNESETKHRGEVILKVVNPKNGYSYKLRFVITEESCTPILGLRAVQDIRLVTVNSETIATIYKETERSILDKYEDVFDKEVGQFEGDLHQADTEACPVKMPGRKWPLSV